MELLEPSTIEAIRFGASWDILDVARIDQGDFEPARLQNLKQRNPVHPSGFHGNRGDATGLQPVGETMQVASKGTKFLDSLGVAISGHTDPMLLRPHIDASGVRMDDRQILGGGCMLRAFFRHMGLQSGVEGESKESFCARIPLEEAYCEG
jgi:hypothetical protein